MIERAIRWPLALLLATWAGAAFAQAPDAAPSAGAKEIPLYPGAAPGSEKWDWSERSVTTPPAELHVFQAGGHGFVHKGGGADHFMDRLEEWLAANKLLSKSTDHAATPASLRPAAAGK
jgi:hypothetical protein